MLLNTVMKSISCMMNTHAVGHVFTTVSEVSRTSCSQIWQANLQFWHLYMQGTEKHLDLAVRGYQYFRIHMWCVYTGRVMRQWFGGQVLADGWVDCGLHSMRASQGLAAASTSLMHHWDPVHQRRGTYNPKKQTHLFSMYIHTTDNTLLLSW